MEAPARSARSALDSTLTWGSSSCSMACRESISTEMNRDASLQWCASTRWTAASCGPALAHPRRTRKPSARTLLRRPHCSAPGSPTAPACAPGAARTCGGCTAPPGRACRTGCTCLPPRAERRARACEARGRFSPAPMHALGLGAPRTRPTLEAGQLVPKPVQVGLQVLHAIDEACEEGGTGGGAPASALANPSPPYAGPALWRPVYRRWGRARAGP